MIKELDDYLGIIQEKYPKISKDELKRVIEHGFSSFHLLAKSGADVVLGNHNYTAFCGKMFFDDYKRVRYNNIKHRIKLRLKYKYAQEVYNGAYYFGLTEAEWEFYKTQITSKRRSKIKFRDLKLYKIQEECYLDRSRTHFFKLYYPIDVGWTFLKSEITTRNFEYIAYRDVKNKIIKLMPPCFSKSSINFIWCSWIFIIGKVFTAHSFASKQMGIPWTVPM